VKVLEVFPDQGGKEQGEEGEAKQTQGTELAREDGRPYVSNRTPVGPRKREGGGLGWRKLGKKGKRKRGGKGKKSKEPWQKPQKKRGR